MDKSNIYKQAMGKKRKLFKSIAKNFIKDNYNISLKDFPEETQFFLKNVLNNTIFDYVRNDKITLQVFDSYVKNIISYFINRNEDLKEMVKSIESNWIPFFSDGDWYRTKYTIFKLINLAALAAEDEDEDEDEDVEKNQDRKEKLDRLLHILKENPKKIKHTSQTETET